MSKKNDFKSDSSDMAGLADVAKATFQSDNTNSTKSGKGNSRSAQTQKSMQDASKSTSSRKSQSQIGGNGKGSSKIITGDDDLNAYKEFAESTEELPTIARRPRKRYWETIQTR